MLIAAAEVLDWALFMVSLLCEDLLKLCIHSCIIRTIKHLPAARGNDGDHERTENNALLQP